MQFNGNWHVGIKHVSVPFPVSSSAQRWNVVGVLIVDAVNRSVADLLKCLLTIYDLLSRNVHIKVALHAQSRTLDIVRSLGESLQNNVLDLSIIQCSNRLTVARLNALKSKRIIRNILLESANHPRREVTRALLEQAPE